MNPIDRADSTRPFARPISREPASRGTSANSDACETATPAPSTSVSARIAASECTKASAHTITAWKTADQIASARVSTRSTSTPTWPASTASGAHRQIKSTATPAPGHSSFARSESAIIATQSPTADTAIAAATRRRSRSRVLAAVTCRNLRL